MQRDEMCLCATKNDDIIANESEDAPPRRRPRRQPLVCRFVLRVLVPRPRETERRERRENEELSLLRFTFSPRDSSLRDSFPYEYERN